MMFPFIRTWIDRDLVESTSDVARALVESGAHALPLLVRADRQTRGRGRGTNAWWSDAGSLTFTLAIDPLAHDLTPAHEPRLALAAAVGLIETIEHDAAPASPCGIRWPNDVECAGRKLAGILPERIVTSDGARMLIGVGLNARSRIDHAPPDVRRLAASLDAVGTPDGVTREPAWILQRFLENFAAILPRLACDDPSLAARWAELDTLRGQPVRVDVGTRIVSGMVHGIDHEGALCLVAEDGPLRIFGGRVLRDP